MKNFPGGINMWSPNHLLKSANKSQVNLEVSSPSNDGVMHDWLVRLVLEVAVPTASKMRSRPAIHLLQFFFSRANLDTSFNAVGSEWSCALEIPLIKDSFLDFRHASDEIIEALSIYVCKPLL